MNAGASTPPRTMRWAWRDPIRGDGLLELTVAAGRGRLVRHYYVQPLAGRRGDRWALARLGACEHVVDLFSAKCTCDGYRHRRRCAHLAALAGMRHLGRL